MLVQKAVGTLLWPSICILILLTSGACDNGTQFVALSLGDESTGRGVAWGDYDNDGDQDIFVAGKISRLYRDDGNDVFVDATSPPISDAVGSGTFAGAVWGDYDNDGDLDLYLTQDFENKLYRNGGSGTFSDATAGPLGSTEDSRGVAWVDFEPDGDLDLYFATAAGLPNRLLRNDGGGSFSDASTAPVADPGNSTGLAWADYDNDGDLDLYVANWEAENKLLRNDGGGLFTDVTATPLNDAGRGQGVAWGDYDNDGDLDLYLANDGPNKLFRNDGGGSFSDVSGSPLNDSDNGFGVAWADYDNDGDLDLYLANFRTANKLFRNDGGGTFADATTAPLDDSEDGPAVAWADYDKDGDLDLYLGNWGSEDKLFRNDLSTTNHWLHLVLTGSCSNNSAIGARVKLVTQGKTLIREVSGGCGFQSQNSLTVEFGLGSATSVDLLEITWPSGEVQTVNVSAVDTELQVVESFSDAPGGLWGRRIRGSYTRHYPKILIKTAAGGFALAGSVMQSGNPTYVFVQKVAPDRSVEWHKTYRADGAAINGLQQTADAGYVVGGYTAAFGAGGTDFWVLKLDSQGDVEWERAYGSSGTEYGFDIAQTADNGYVLTGMVSTSFGGYDAGVLKLDAAGDVQWRKTYGGNFWDETRSVKQTADGGFVIAGKTYSAGAGQSDFWVLKLDAAGDVQWQKTYGGTSYDEAQSIEEIAGGGYIVAGWTESFGTSGSQYATDFWLLRLDGSGDVVWQKAYRGATQEHGFGATLLGSGDVIAWGTSHPGSKLRLIKTDSSGAIGWAHLYEETPSGTVAFNPVLATASGFVIAGRLPAPQFGKLRLTALDSGGLSDAACLGMIAAGMNAVTTNGSVAASNITAVSSTPAVTDAPSSDVTTIETTAVPCSC